MPRVIHIGGDAEIELIGVYPWGGGSVSSFEFSSIPYGVGTVVVALATQPGFTTSVTIGGVSATQYRLPGSGLETTIRFYVADSSAASGDVIVTRDGATSLMAIAVWSVTGNESATPTDYETAYAASPAVSVSVAGSGGGVLAAFAFGSASGSLTGIDGTAESSIWEAGYAEIPSDSAGLTITHTASAYVGAITFR